MILFPFRGLRTGVLAALIILIVAAMLLVDLLLVKTAQDNLAVERMNTGRVLLAALSEIVTSAPDTGTTTQLSKTVERLLPLTGFSSALLTTSDGTSHISVGDWGGSLEDARASALEALATSNPVHRFSGTSWGVVWFAPRTLTMSAGIRQEGKEKIAFTVAADLTPLYNRLRKDQIVFLVFLALYASFLILAGMYLFSKAVFAPLRRLLTMAAGVEEIRSATYMPPPARNELVQLFMAVSDILSHLEKNKASLREHIASLERANEELRRAQDELVRSEKLASTGRLAAGIAHEIGNPLGIISGYLELLRSGELRKEEEADLTDRIDGEIGRIGRIIRQMLDLARPSPPRKETVSIHSLLLETLDFLEGQSWLSSIHIRTMLESDRDTVSGDRERLRETFINIIMNAADAMEEGGTLTILTARYGGSIRIAFSDTGPGIPPENLMSVFDPFFTTKEPGRGTGLGLWVCYRTITEMGGKIEALNREEGGAQIAITIELADHQEVHGVL